MTEAEWLACESPRDLAAFARGKVEPARFRWLAAEWGLRERRLFDWGEEREFDQFTAWVVGVGPAVAPAPGYVPAYHSDPDSGRPQRLTWAWRCLYAIRHGDFAGAAALAAEGAIADSPEAETNTRRAFAAQFRCAAGDPFRPAALDPAGRTPDAVDLARAAFASADFSLLPVLADALEEAGCDAADLLGHLRGGGPHGRGCWALGWARAPEGFG